MANSVSDKDALALWGGTSDAGNTLSDKDALKLWDGASGEPGSPGADPYAGGPGARQSKDPITPTGTLGDMVKSAANTAALKAGPQLAGGLAALLQPALNNERFSRAMMTGKPLPNDMPSMGDAYRDVRNETARELGASARTAMGQAGDVIGTVATPVPIKGPGPNASMLSKSLYGGGVGGTAGFIQGAAQSKGDLTTMDSEQWKRVLKDALAQGLPGAGGGAIGGATLSVAEPKLRSAAETQALRAAGLRGGIKNSVKKDLGLSNMDEARELGREFLDEGLIPPIGSSEAVGKRAEALQGAAGNAKSSVLNQADVSGGKYDYGAGADAARARIDSESAVATDLSGDKAYRFADAFEKQGAKTPGSYVGADRAKSDAWKSANFADDAPMAAQLYRKGVGAARDDIENQVRAALGPQAASTLNAANKKYGIAADALKLAENASTRDAAKKGITAADLLLATSGGTVGGFSGSPGTGVAGGVAAALAAKGFDKYGHSSTARFADFLSKRAGQNTGGVVGGGAANALAPYLELLHGEEPKP